MNYSQVFFYKQGTDFLVDSYGQVKIKFIVYVLLFCIMLFLAGVFLSFRMIEKRDAVRMDRLEKVMEALGRYYLDQREVQQVENPHFPHILDKEGSWEKLKSYVRPFMDSFPEEMDSRTRKSYYSYLSNKEAIGPPGICFVLEVRLDNKAAEETLGPLYAGRGCARDNEKLCFFETGVYEAKDGYKYYRLAGGGC